MGGGGTNSGVGGGNAAGGKLVGTVTVADTEGELEGGGGTYSGVGIGTLLPGRGFDGGGGGREGITS